ncbi:UNVERIFIED_CONTAM: Regulation of nuclear pre-mRNA domain containing protein 1B [Gekko kuhli]
MHHKRCATWHDTSSAATLPEQYCWERVDIFQQADGGSSQTASGIRWVFVTEEKKSLKRTFQQIQEEEDDDYPGSYSPQDANAGPLLSGCWGGDFSGKESPVALVQAFHVSGSKGGEHLLNSVCPGFAELSLRNETEDLIKALQDLENAASGDATVRQKIASLPQEVQDVSLLEKITDKEAAERLSKTVDEACLLLAEYNGRLAAELEDRRQLARMLIEYTQNQKDVLTEKEKKLEPIIGRTVDA